MSRAVDLVRRRTPLSLGCTSAWLSVIAVAALVAPSLAATVWYVSSGITGRDPGGITGPDTVFSDAPSDLNAGTDPDRPLRTLGPGGLQSRMADGDTAYISGRFYIPDATPTAFLRPVSCNARTFAQWPGMPPAMIRGSNKAGVDGWTRAGVAAYSKNIGPGLGGTLATVVFDYDSVRNIGPLEDAPDALPALGRRRSHLTPASALQVLTAPATGTSGMYFYDNASGALSVFLPGGASPESAVANGVEYSVRGRMGFYLSSDGDADRVNSGNVFRGLRFALWADGATGSPRGSPIAVSNGDSTIIADCVFEDSGIHSYSFGQRCTRNLCLNNTHIGMAPVGIACVFNASGFTGGQPNAAWGCRIINDRVYANSFLAHDGTLANPGDAVGAFICHGGVADIALENFRVIEYAPPAGGVPDRCAHFTVADAPPPEDPLDPATYAVRIRQTDPGLATIANGTAWPDQGMTSNVAYLNCVFQFPRFGGHPAASMIDLTSCAGTTGFFACEFTADLGNHAIPAAMFAVGTASSLVNLNCSGYDTSALPNAQGRSIYRYNGRGGRVYDFQSVWGFRDANSGTRRACVGDADLGPEYHVFGDVAFWNIDPGALSENAAFGTLDQWRTVIDSAAGGVTLHLDRNPFLDPSGTKGLAPTPEFRGLVKFVSPHAEQGINGRRYDGRYGAYQYDEARCPADADANGFVNGADFDAFMPAFLGGDDAADIDGNGFVNGVDFDTFLAHFAEGC